MKRNKILTATLFLLFIFTYTFKTIRAQEVYVANWNLENLFDTKNDANKNDEEFTPEGRKHWNEQKLNLKLKHLAKVVSLMNNAKGPDLLGVEEVEHKALLEKLLGLVVVGKTYGIAYAESPDKRGIDNGLIFNEGLFKLISVKTIRVDLPSGYPTRYILHVKLKAANNSIVHVFVNHWPSRRGGLHRSQPNRVKAAEELFRAIKSILSKNRNSFIIALGDFNDEPTNYSIKKVLSAAPVNCNKPNLNSALFNLAYRLKIKGMGTYLYRKHWNMLDQIIVSRGIIEKNSFNYECGSFGIFKPKFVIEKTGRYKGAILPTFGGRKYLGGYSDHYPVFAKFFIVKYEN